LVNRIQNLRKDSGFQVTDRIEVFLQADESLEDSIRLNLDYIKKETLTDNLQLVPQLNKGIEISFDEVNSKLYIQKFK
jgi:isoleucyl-tRNA synthetase